MIARMFRKCWMHLLIAFSDNYTVEGFERTMTKFELPENLGELDPEMKRKLTICNLFANQNLSIRDICVVLDANKHQVVDTLIENNLIKERRRKNRAKGKGSSLLCPSLVTALPFHHSSPRFRVKRLASLLPNHRSTKWQQFALQPAIRHLAESRLALSLIELIDRAGQISCRWIEEMGKKFVSIFKKFWMHLLISFSDNYTVEGFEKTENSFDLPEHLSELDSEMKRKLTICNLFANQNLSISDICVVLDANKHQVIDALIENNLIKERRRKNRAREKEALSITPPDETTSESINPNSAQDPKDSGRTGSEAESDIHYERRTASTLTASESKTETEQDRRIA